MFAILTIFLFLLAAWVLLVVPQQRRQRAHQQVLGALAVGQEVITTAGLYGTIAALDGDVVHLEVAPGTTIRIARLAILRPAVPAVPADAANTPEG